MTNIRDTEAKIIAAFLALQAVVTGAIANARQQGRDEALAQIREIIGGGEPARRGPGRPKGSKNTRKTAEAKPTKSGKKRKNSWAGLSPDARLARVNAIRKGRGLAPKEG